MTWHDTDGFSFTPWLDSSVFLWDCRNGTAGLDWIEGKGFDIEEHLSRASLTIHFMKNI